MKKPSLDELVHAARLASVVVEKAFRNPHAMGLEWKADDTPLTIADRAVRDLVCGWMSKDYPHIPVVGEESQLGLRTGAADEHWLLIDEVDGTWAYMLGVPVFSCLFALMQGNKPVVSVIADPIADRIYWAKEGDGAYMNDNPIKTQRQLPKNPTVGICTWPYRNHPSDMLVRNMMSGAESVASQLHRKGFIVYNCSTIGYFDAMVASGHLAGTIFPGGTLHDTAAGHLLVEEAGGWTSDLRGYPLRYGDKNVHGHVFAANNDLWNDLLEIVQRANWELE